MHPPELPILGPLTKGATERHLVRLPGVALASDEPRPVITVTGAKSGPILFVNAGVHGCEYPAIEAVIRLGRTLDPSKIAGTIVLMPVLNVPSFRTRTPFVCPIDNVNPNRVFPGGPNGSYSEQMTHALVSEFIDHADVYIDLHGGDIPEALVPFSICRGGTAPVDLKSKELSIAFGLPYVLTVTKPVQPAKGSSSYAAAAERGIPAVLAEAGGVGQLQQDAVELLVNGVVNVMRHLAMLETENAADKHTATAPTILTSFEWVYTRQAGLFYPEVAAGDRVRKGQEIGTVGSLFGDVVENIISPANGIILFLTINPSVLEKGLLMGIGVE